MKINLTATPLSVSVIALGICIGAMAQNIPPTLKVPIPTFTAQQIPALCQSHIQRAKGLQVNLRKVSPSMFMEKWNELSLGLDRFSGQMGLIANVSPEKTLRSAAEKCGLELSKFAVELFQDTQLYTLIKKTEGVDGIDAKLKEDLIYGFEKSGAGLSPKGQARYKVIVAQMEKITQDFNRNIRDNPTKVLMSDDDMVGLPMDYINAQKKNKEGRYELGFEYPQYQPFMMLATSSEARKRYYMAFQNRGTDKNLPILEELVKLRTEMAQLFGLKTYAQYALQKRMAQTPKNVLDFLAQVRETVNEGEKQDLDKIQAFRAKVEKVSMDAAKINRWDLAYWENAYKKANFNVDQEALRAYMLAEPTIDWALSMTANMYGVKLQPRQVPTWHKDVRYFDVIEAKSRQIISGIYLDLYPREGKYGHAAAFPVQGSSTLAGQLPISVLVTNFNRKGFSYQEMNTLLHELGHVMHGALSNTRYVDQSGTSVERDFVEVPSQMYEEWGRRYETLSQLSKSCAYCKPFTPELVAQINAAEKFGKGIFYARQWLYASYDMALYGEDYAKTPQGVLPLWEKMEGATQVGHVKGTQFPGNFAHIAGGYAAGYYSYMWSEVIVLDIVSAFGDNLLNPKLGRAFRDLVLSQGSQQTGSALARDFLGREPSPYAFFKEITGK